MSAHVVRSGLVRIPRRRGWTRYSSRTLYLFIAPWVLGFIFLTLFPLGYALRTSFTNMNGLALMHPPRFIGLDNYREILSDPNVRSSLESTLIYTVVAVPIVVAVALGLAVLLNWRIRGIALFRTIFYLPAVVPVVATAISFKLVFDQNSGLVNGIVTRLGGNAVAWLVDPYVFWVLVLMIVWGLGTAMIIFLAGLQGIPQDLLDAAAVDGASGLRTFVSITVPLLSPVIFFQVITQAIYALQILVQPLLLSGAQATGGGAGGLTPDQTIQGTYVYMVNVDTEFFVNNRFGYGSALVWVLFVLILLITLVVVRTGALWVYYDVDVD